MPSKFLPLPAHTVERLKELPQRVATLEGLIALWLFGSFARDAWTPISDVDLAYLRTRDVQAIVERRLQTAIESCLHIGNHLIARLGLRPPQDYGDVFRILRDAYILPSECAEAMVDMARFRNLLVHLYWQLDYERIYDSLPGRCASLEAFASHIGRWLRDQG